MNKKASDTPSAFLWEILAHGGNYFSVVALVAAVLTPFIPPELFSKILPGGLLAKTALSAGFALLSILVASYRAWKDLKIELQESGELGLVPEVLGPAEVHALGGVIRFQGRDVIFAEELDLQAKGTLRIKNEGAGISTRIVIADLRCGLSSEPIEMEEVEPEIFDKAKERHRNQFRVDNPYYLEPNQMLNLEFVAKLPVRTEKIERSCGALGSIRCLSATLRVEPVGKTPWSHELTLDLSPMHSATESNVAGNIQRGQNRPSTFASEVLSLLKRYWVGDAEELESER